MAGGIIKSTKTSLKRLKGEFIARRTNLRGEKIKGKYIVIESDDWGAIRTPSSQALKDLQFRGIDLDHSVYKNDALASEDDLDALFNTLLSYQDSIGSNAKFTANTIVANPDFERIQGDNFTRYYYEPITTTLARYPRHKESFSKWQEAIEKGVFKPQFHGREHLNVNRWMSRLRSNDELTKYCFELGMTYSGEDDYSFMEAYDWDTKADIPNQIDIINDGVRLFEQIFGYKSASFIAPCYNWDPEIEPALSKNGIKSIQGIRSQLIPTGEFENYQSKEHFFGEVGVSGLRHTIRNCFLEPSLNPHKDWVDSCLAQIRNAFSWQKPAIICSHRINYVGYIDVANRDRGLKDLNQLLTTALKKWPEVEFITTDQLIKKLAWQ